MTLGPLRDEVREHNHLARLLTVDDREWLRSMADVLPPGAVVLGMATRPREGVMPSGSGALLVRGPSDRAGQARAR